MPKSLSETHFARSVASVPHHSDYPCPRHNSHGQWSVFHFNPKTLDRILVENTHQFYVFSVPCLLRSLPETHFIFSMVCVSHLSTNKFTCLADQEIGVISLPRKRQPRLYFFPLLGHKGTSTKPNCWYESDQLGTSGNNWDQAWPLTRFVRRSQHLLFFSGWTFLVIETASPWVIAILSIEFLDLTPPRSILVWTCKSAVTGTG